MNIMLLALRSECRLCLLLFALYCSVGFSTSLPVCAESLGLLDKLAQKKDSSKPLLKGVILQAPSASQSTKKSSNNGADVSGAKVEFRAGSGIGVLSSALYYVSRSELYPAGQTDENSPRPFGYVGARLNCNGFTTGDIARLKTFLRWMITTYRTDPSQDSQRQRKMALDWYTAVCRETNDKSAAAQEAEREYDEYWRNLGYDPRRCGRRTLWTKDFMGNWVLDKDRGGTTYY